ncbi:hypothetical protein [Pseudomonas atacamensis]|uniref:hypothetical protein n=1 Tax=Pseudomonas atacamensis TaxID=2565368 RepID=UPI003CC49A0A
MLVLTTDSLVTILGTIVTLLSMIVAMRQASQAKNYKNQLMLDVRRINLANVIEGLKSAQEEIRRLPASNQKVPRGVNVSELIHKIRAQFDNSLGTLNSFGPDASIRAILVEAQTKLNAYAISLHDDIPNAQHVHELQAKMQDAVSALGTTINQMEGKA